MTNDYPYRVDAALGIVYGISGRPVTRHDHVGYVVVRRRGHSQRMAHRVIWESVNGPVPKGKQINHINGIKNDNRIGNLEVVTPSQNCRHAHKTGLATNKGVRNPRAKLTEASVRAIRAEVAAGVVQEIVARRYCISQVTVSKVALRQTWSHVE